MARTLLTIACGIRGRANSEVRAAETRRRRHEIEDVQLRRRRLIEPELTDVFENPDDVHDVLPL